MGAAARAATFIDRTESLQERWRRIAGEAPLLPGEYAAMLATRVEAQVAADWMAVPIARNLHWRCAVLHSAFMTCKQKVAPGEALSHNLECLFEATKTMAMDCLQSSVGQWSEAEH